MKKTVSVSIDERLLEIAKGKAWEAKMSLSRYFETKLTTGWDASEVGKPVRTVTRVKVVEGSNFCEYCGKAHWGACTGDDLRASAERITEHLKNQVEDLVEIDSKVKSGPILTKEIKTLKGSVKANEALENFFKPQPKAKWKGAK